MAMNPRLLRPRASGARHPEALDWASRATANGGTVDSASLAAADAFCRAVDAGGIRSKLSHVNLLIGGNLNAALVPLYRSFSFGGTAYGNATATNNNFTSNDYTLSGGLAAVTTTRNLNLGTALLWATSLFDIHAGVGLSNAGPTGQYGVWYFGAPNISSRTWIDINNGFFRGYFGSNVAGEFFERDGRFVTSRVSQSSIRSWNNGAAGFEKTSSVADEDRSSLPVVIGSNSGGQVAGLSFWYYHMGTGLTAGDVAILDAALVSYLTIIGRS